MPLISVVINADTRNGFQHHDTIAEKMFDGCRSLDFLIDGVETKKRFFSGFDIETILFIDQHIEIPSTKLEKIRDLVDVLVIRNHTNEPNFNDFNYVSALQLARGEIIAHFDQDTNAFASLPLVIQKQIDLLNTYDYISYPSYWSPLAINDDSFNYSWASTRYFLCKRETLDFTEILKCQRNYEYFIETYQPSRVCHWIEHILGAIATRKGKGVYYPPMNLNEYAVFSWGAYKSGTLKYLNQLDYGGILNWLNSNPIVYPCDIHI